MKDLVLNKLEIDLDKNNQYKDMVVHISSLMPAIHKNSSNFYKTDSQMKEVTLNIADITPFTRLKHILARIERTKEALRENYFVKRKKKNEINQKYELLQDSSGLEKELLEIEIEEKESELEISENYIKGAIRLLNFLVTQYEVTMKSMDKEFITEEEYEESEATNHIAIALKQALCAARSRNGVIDEGNHIYLFELGINGTTLQTEMYKYFTTENEMLALGQEPTHEMQMKWIQKMIDKYQHNPAIAIRARNLKQMDSDSLVRAIND